jgi:hypothetical protein
MVCWHQWQGWYPWCPGFIGLSPVHGEEIESEKMIKAVRDIRSKTVIDKDNDFKIAPD